MALQDILSALGIDQIIWIDDVFGEPEEDLALLAAEHPELADEFAELAPAFALKGFGDVDTALKDTIAKLDDHRLAKLRVALLQADAENAPAPELGRNMIHAVAQTLEIAKEDLWTFDEADQKLSEKSENDANLAYIIDLKEAGGKEQRGLDAVKLLRSNGSKSVAFILTHETEAAGEMNLEKKLTHDIGDAVGHSPLITVISKERLTKENANVEGALSIALKRAGLRRTLYEVLAAATNCAAKAFGDTALSLLELAPEQLEKYVYEQGRKEGVSELSVVERALSAGASKEMRSFFGTDAIALHALQTLRILKSVDLDAEASEAGAILTDLRNAEVWDDGTFINAALTPLANGDVFRFDECEPTAPKSTKLFAILGQPCDIALRADGKRVSEMVMMAPLVELQNDGEPVPDPNDPDEDERIKAPAFPFRLNGKKFKIDLRYMAYVRSSILDLACFRTDGCVRVEIGQVAPEQLLAGAKSIYGARTVAADEALAAPAPPPLAAEARLPVDDRLLLTMSDVKPWSIVRMGKRMAAFDGAGHQLESLPERVTWFLRRHGRIRPPYSSFLLERALRTLGRRAFDSDFGAD